MVARKFPGLFRRSLLVMAACGATLPSVFAQPAPKINSLSREWFQRGAPASFKIAGENLAGVKEIRIDGSPGVTASVVPPAAPTLSVESSLGGVSNVVPPDTKSISVALQIDPAAAFTEREIRVVTEGGISNPLPFRLSHLPEVNSARANTSRENAQVITFPVIVSGTIGASTETDFYQFEAKKGDRLIFDLHAYRIGSPLDSTLAVVDAEGRELARDEDAHGLDSILKFEVPADGRYVIELRDFRYQGGGNYKYRLVAGALPLVEAAFPFGGQRGATTEVTLKGANLDGAEKMLLHLASDAPVGQQEIRASSRGGLSNPFLFEVSDLPHRMESEPNSALDQADELPLPIAMNGRIGQDKDYDAFKLRASKGQRFVFEVHAARFQSPLDALLTLTDDRGNILQRNDDAGTSDARLDHTFGADGDFFLLVEDLLHRGGDDYAYRLTATTPQPDFSALFLPDAPRIRRGGRVPVRCEISRANGFNEAVKISAEGLPSGVFAEPLILSPNSASGWIVLHATPDAPMGTFPLRLAASGVINGNRTVRQLQPISGDRAARAGYITILEEAPFAVEVTTLMSSIEQNQSGQIEIAVERKNGFAGEIKISPEGFSFGRDPVTRSFEFAPLVLKPSETRGTLSLKAKLDCEIGARPLLVRAEADLNGQTFATYSSLAPVTTTQIPFVLSTTLKRVVVTALPSGTESAAATGEFVVKVERRAGFDGEIELKLEGAPEGIAATVPKIPAGAAEIPVKLVASDKAPTGKDFTLTLTGLGVHNDRNYRFQPAPVTLTINAPEPVETAQPKVAAAAP